MVLRRTLLWVPGNRWEAIVDSINTEADCLTLDLEDTVPHSEKDAARKTVLKALQELDFGRKETIVRINPIDTSLGRTDLEAILEGKPKAIRLPKCEAVEYVLALDKVLLEFETQTGHSTKIILMIETPLGVRNSFELASCSKRITAIGLGAEDLTTSLGTKRSTTGLEIELLYARQKLIMDGRAAGVDVLDSSCLAIDNLDDLRAETEMVKQMGFDGKSVIDKVQIKVVNEVFSPKAVEIEYARKVIEAYKNFEKQGSLLAFLDGKLIDVPVVKKAKDVLMRAKAAGLL
jgi:citrate lyase subunit beta/citryl-CoA lyase